jgi:hypothetical protein
LALGKANGFEEGAIKEKTAGIAYNIGYELFNKGISLHAQVELGYTHYQLTRKEYPIKSGDTGFSRLEFKNNSSFPNFFELGAGPCVLRDILCGLVTYSFITNGLFGTPINYYNQPSPVGATTNPLNPHGLGLLVNFDVGRAVSGMYTLYKIDNETWPASSQSGR